VGRRRTNNEDCFFLSDTEPLALVADGMGGHASGEVASREAVGAAAGFFRASHDAQPSSWPCNLLLGRRWHDYRLAAAFRIANRRVHDVSLQEARLTGMGTTLIGALFVGDEVLLGHIGDSRAYRVRDGRIEQLTVDHSLANDYIRIGRLSRADAELFAQRNVIVRALGMREEARADVGVERLRLGDLYVLCSDGLSGMLSDEGIRQLAGATPDLDRGCEALIDAANRAGGEDNITVVLARVERE
jgi:protein phosphatase